jgi:hypothetical protein
MSLQDAAKHLAAQGRGADTALVHMSPKELSSLQKLAIAHGGNLTVNPKTGLPEAGFLDSILPMVLGGALTVATGGAAAPLIGAGIGALQYARTGDLGKGIMAGLGAYGGAGLAGGLMSLGSTAPEVMQAANASPDKIEGLINATNNFTTPKLTGIEALQSGAQQAMSDPTSALRNIGSGSALKGAGILGAAAAPMLFAGQNQQMPGVPSSGPNPYQYKYQPNVTTPFPQPDVPGYGNQGRNFGREQRYYSGQYVPVAKAQDPTQPIQMAEGGSAHLGDYSDGGHLLRGPGDGVSDSIPATIGGRRPARLADGEFVVPARIVSELGNGSTEAGARKLYAMMGRVQSARGKTTGKDRVAANTKADRYLPA